MIDEKIDGWIHCQAKVICINVQSMCVCARACMSVCLCVCVRKCVCVCVRIGVCMCERGCVCVYLCSCIFMLRWCAYCSMRRRHSSIRPQVAAACSGVHSSQSMALTLAPNSSRTCIIPSVSSMQH